MKNTKKILDPCCGSRMFYFDKKDPKVIFGDIRNEKITLTDRSNGNKSGTREIIISPDFIIDFRNLPYCDGSFKLVCFDPPHLIRAGEKSWLASKYGRLSDNWKEDIRAGFSECFRVLCDEGIMIFKWNETQVKVKDILELTERKPLLGHLSGRKNLTHWMVFVK